MINILVGDVSTTIQNPKEHLPVIAKIREVCKARPENYQFMPKYKAGLWDGYISLMHGFAAFPSGLVNKVCDVLDLFHYQYHVCYLSPTLTSKPVSANILRGVELREYQIEAVNVMLEHGRGVMKMATNSGKTEVIAAVIKALDCNTLVILHRKELMYQTAQRFKDRGVADKVGLIGDGHFEPEKLTVGMIQTLFARRDETIAAFSKNQMVICDETHHASSDTMMDILNVIPGGYRFGLSGTPLKDDILSDMKLMAATGPLLFDLDNKFLIDSGFSAKPIIHIMTIEMDDNRWWKADYQTAYDALIVHNEERNKKITGFAKQSGGTILILVNRIEHGLILKDLMPNATYVTGSDTTEFRQQTLEDMRSKPGIYIASPIFDEGVDVPGVDVVIIAGGGASPLKLLQRIGRGLRYKEGRNRLDVLDFIDDTNKHLIEHSDARIDTYVREGFKTELDK